MAIHTPVPGEEAHLLFARLDDLTRVAARGELAISRFLTPREAAMAARHMAARLSAGGAVLYGGYAQAQRVRAVILPDYAEGLCDPEALRADPAAALLAVGLSDLAESLREAVATYAIRGSGFRALCHRDYLGSILALGLERDALGDVCVVDTPTDGRTTAGGRGTVYQAYVFTDTRMGAFLMSHLEKVANDTVEVKRLPPDTPLSLDHPMLPIRDTVASERLDCVVAALCNLSRDKAQTAIRQGLVEVDYEPCLACDTVLSPPCVLTIRGVGRFALHAFDGETRKGRLRVVAGKYV